MIEAPDFGWRTKEYSDDELLWRCQRCGHTTDTRDHGHEYSCGARAKMVPVDPYTETPIKFEHMTVFERWEWEEQANSS